MPVSILRLMFVLFALVSLPLMANTKVLILGDSLSAAYGMKQEQGWVNLLQNTYLDTNQPVNLINASISGETTGGALRRLPALLKQHAPSHVLIELGGNDGLRGFPVERMKANLDQLIRLSQQNGADVALMKIRIPPNYGPRYNKLFSDSFTQVAKRHPNVQLMPFFIESVATEPTLMQNDGIHPNEKAQPRLAERMQIELARWLTKNVNSEQDTANANGV